MAYEFSLLFDGVNPGLDLASIHGAFFEDDMDVLVGCAQLEQGRLALDVSTHDGEARSVLNQVLATADRALGPCRRVAVGPDAVELQEIGFRTELPESVIQAYAREAWFPRPVDGDALYRLDEAARALASGAGLSKEVVDRLVATTEAARACNEQRLSAKA